MVEVIAATVFVLAAAPSEVNAARFEVAAGTDEDAAACLGTTASWNQRLARVM